MADPLFPTSQSVKKLREYHQDKLNELNVDEISAALLNETDRAKVILSCAVAEDLLDYRIEQKIDLDITSSQERHIFRFEGPLGRFSYKIEVAYVFGIIDKSTAKQLHLIREMRNACAHSKFKLSFQMDVLSDVAKQLFKPIGAVVPLGSTPDNIRSAFLAELWILFQTLTLGSREAAISWVLEHTPAIAGFLPSLDK